MTNKRKQRYNLLCSTADQMVIAKGVKPGDLVCYEVSMAAFGTKPNGDTYLLFEE